jgi:hypothetical protein
MRLFSLLELVLTAEYVTRVSLLIVTRKERKEGDQCFQ